MIATGTNELLSTDDSNWHQLICYTLMIATDINEFAIYWWKQLTLMNLLSTDESNWY